jgi:methylmalonyl-CoA decarboxylase
MPLVLEELHADIGSITLDHPERRKAPSAVLVVEVVSALGWFRASKARAVVLRAPAGAEAWSAAV